MNHTPPPTPSSLLVVGFGNPLLDIQLHTDEQFLKQYKLVPSGYTFQGADQEGIYEDMKARPNPCYVAGGATLNAMRVCQALWRNPGSVFYTGCVGQDDLAVKMQALCDVEGLIVQFSKSDRNPTGVCGVCIVDKERSLCARLGAAQDFKLEHLKAHWSCVLQGKVFYVAGFVLEVCAEGMRQVGVHCAESNKLFSSNLAAPFFVEGFKDQMMSVMPYVDILFGNETEYASFAKVHGWGDNLPLDEIAERIAKLPKANIRRPRLVVITQGILPTVIASRWHENGLVKVTRFPVIPLSNSEIVDTNAAGDAFVGGFLYGILKQMEASGNLSSPPDEVDVDYSVHCAHVAARHILQRDGCSFDFSAEEFDAVSIKRRHRN